MTPREEHLKILRNCANGRPFEEGFILQESAVRSMFQCLCEGWVERSQITDKGRQVLAQHDPKFKAASP
jgi:hypothetical protein